jgi:hypothetical protein
MKVKALMKVKVLIKKGSDVGADEGEGYWESEDADEGEGFH